MRDILQHPQCNGGDQNTVAPLVVAPQTNTPIRPETFRLPRNKERDPYFGNTRPWYYQIHKEVPCLIHLRKRGKQRGVTLVDYDAVLNYIRSQKGIKV